MRCRLALSALTVGALAYASWVAGPLVNGELSATTTLISELAAAGQPGAWLFRLGDAVAGALVAVAALVLGHRAHSRRTRFGWATLVAFGLVTVVDGLSPLSCVATIDRHCAAAEQAWLVPTPHAVHLVTSSLAGALLVTAMGLLWSVTDQGRWLLRTAALVSAASLAWTLAALDDPALLAGLAQRLSVGAASVWLLVLAVNRHRQALAAASTERTATVSAGD